MFEHVGLIGKGGCAREILSGMKDYNPILLSDLDGTLDKSYSLPINYLLCIGDSTKRRSLFQKLEKDLPLNRYMTYVTCHAEILDRDSVTLGIGTIVCHGSVLTCNIKIGTMALVNINTTICHDVTIGDFFTSAPGVHISGNCTIGDNVMIGSNATLRDNIVIGDNVIIGMGSVVTKSILEPGVYVGNPCKKIRSKEDSLI